MRSIVLITAISLFQTLASAFPARVVGVSDGDTLTVVDTYVKQHKIRLAGIDSPEKGQDFGNKAKEYLSDMVFGKVVSIPDEKLDRYGRTVSRVLVGNMDVGLEMVKAGFAWHYKKYESEQNPSERISYAHAQEQAMHARNGLWALANATKPEDYRRATKSPFSPVLVTSQANECPCGTGNMCSGPRGGRFCLDVNGKKKYMAH